MNVEICKLDRNRNVDKLNITWLVQAIDAFSHITKAEIESYDLGNASSAFSYYALASEAFSSDDYSTHYMFDKDILLKSRRTDLKKLVPRNGNPAALASMCRNFGVLEDYGDSIRLTPFASALYKENKVLIEEYVFALLSKQWVKVDGECKRPLLSVIYDLCTAPGSTFLSDLSGTDEKQQEAAMQIAMDVIDPSVVVDPADIELERAKMDILRNHLLLSGLFAYDSAKQIVMTREGEQILKAFKDKEGSLPKYADTSSEFKRYIGSIGNGAFVAIDETNAAVYKQLYPNLTRIALGFIGKASSGKSSMAAPLILYGPPGTGKTFTLQTEYIAKYSEHFVTTFHQSFSYEEFVEGLKPVLDDSSKEVSYRIEKGIFYQACERAAELAGYSSLEDCIKDTPSNRKLIFDKAVEDKKTVLFCIDEINRGNVASIFGDQISLIEPSKRLGAGALEMTAILPYSKKLFGVPANLVIVGTMNTADRSIQLLDSALRRRFKFEELLPKYAVIEDHDAREVLKTINARVRCLLNKDNQIGHSYLISAKGACDILSALYNKIIPLLEEYFYNDIEKVRFVLNDSKNSQFYVEDTEAKEAYQLYLGLEVDEEERKFFKLNPDIVAAISSEDEAECKKYLVNLLPVEEK